MESPLLRLPQELLDMMLDGCPVDTLNNCLKTCSALYHLAHPHITRSIAVGSTYDLLLLVWKCHTIPDTYRHTTELALPPNPACVLVNDPILIPRFAMKRLFSRDADGFMDQDEVLRFLYDFDYSAIATVFDTLQVIHLESFSYLSPPSTMSLDSIAGPLKAGDIRVLSMDLCTFSSPDVLDRVLAELPRLKHLELSSCGFDRYIPQADITAVIKGAQSHYRLACLSTLKLLASKDIIFEAPHSIDAILPLLSRISVPGVLRSIATVMDKSPGWAENVARVLARHGPTLHEFTLQWIWGAISGVRRYRDDVFKDADTALATYGAFIDLLQMHAPHLSRLHVDVEFTYDLSASVAPILALLERTSRLALSLFDISVYFSVNVEIIPALYEAFARRVTDGCVQARLSSMIPGLALSDDKMCIFGWARVGEVRRFKRYHGETELDVVITDFVTSDGASLRVESEKEIRWSGVYLLHFTRGGCSCGEIGMC